MLPPTGYIGLGDMGAAMAHNLIDRGVPLTIYARRAVTLDGFRDRAVTIVPSPRAVGECCAILCLCVVDEVQIEDVLFGPDGAIAVMAPGSTIVIHSTVSPEACRGWADRLAAHGIGLIDAPVSGAAQRGRDGTLTIAVGGDPGTVARCMPLLAIEGSLVAHLGPVGSGQIGKLLNNGLFIVQASLVDEIVRLGAAMRLDPAKVLEVINSGTAASWASGFTVRMRAAGKPVYDATSTTYPGGTLGIVEKDVRLFRDQLRASGLAHARIDAIAAGAVAAMAQDIVAGRPD